MGFGILNTSGKKADQLLPLVRQIAPIFYDHESEFGIELLGSNGARVGLARRKSRPVTLAEAYEQVLEKG